MRTRLIATLLTLAALTARADVVVLMNGHEIVGTVVQQDFEAVTIETRDGTIRLNMSSVREVRRAPTAPPAITEPAQIDPDAQLPPPGPLGEEPAPEAQEVVAAPAAVPGTPGEAPEPTGERIAPPEIEPGYVAAIFMIDGVLEVLRNQPTWESAELGMQMQAGHEIRTGEGRSEIVLRGRGEVRMPPESHMQIEEIDDAGNNVRLALVRGSVWADVEAPDSGGLNFNVTTPDLTAGVRGTVFNVQAAPGSGSRVSVVEGRVMAQSILRPGQAVEVFAGYSVFCDEDGNLTAPEPIEIDLEAEFEYWDQWALEVSSSVGVGAGSGAIDNLARLNAMDQQRYAQINAEWAASENTNRQAEFLDALRDAFTLYTEDTGELPPSEEEHGADGWRALMEDPGAAGWLGPYLPPETVVPVLDGWGHPITYRRQRSDVSGNFFGELISNGPNGLFSDGRTDDLRVMILLSAEVQAAMQANAAP